MVDKRARERRAEQSRAEQSAEGKASKGEREESRDECGRGGSRQLREEGGIISHRMEGEERERKRKREKEGLGETSGLSRADTGAGGGA